MLSPIGTRLIVAASIILLTLPQAMAQQQPYGEADYARLRQHGFVGFDYQVREIADIETDVGYSTFIIGAHALCNGEHVYPSHNSLVSGVLPPGLEFAHFTDGSTNMAIAGVPTERGHWIVTVRLGTVSCNGRTYGGWEQRLHIHVGGSGQVVR